MFTQNHRTDFDQVLRTRRPFAFIRFGDGEHAIIAGQPHRSADAWSTVGSTWIRAELKETLSADLDGFCLGLPPPCCLLKGLGLRALVEAPINRQTVATLFMHGNLPRALELRDRFAGAVEVSARYGDIRVPEDGVTQEWDVDAVVTQLLAVDRPILLAAGPLSNIIAYRYWTRQDPKLRQTILDVGSVLDVIHGNVTRYYHGQMNSHFCAWHEPDRGTRTRRVIEHHDDVERVVIGRQRPQRLADLHVVNRIRIGKR